MAEIAEPDPYLQVLAIPGGQGSDGELELPAPFVEGQEHFDQADEAADKEDYGTAASTYLKAARSFRDLDALDQETREEWAETLNDARDMAYSNALECFAATGQRAAGVKALKAEVDSHPGSAKSVELLLIE